MKRFLPLILSLFIGSLLIAGCGEERHSREAPSDANMSRSISQPPRTATADLPRNALPAGNDHNRNSPDRSLLKKMGIEINGDKIVFDTQKTKSFLEHLSRTLRSTVEKIGPKSIQTDSTVGNASETGIRVSKEKVIIDLNRTKHFMQKWVRSLEELSRELNESLGEALGPR